MNVVMYYYINIIIFYMLLYLLLYFSLTTLIHCKGLHTTFLSLQPEQALVLNCVLFSTCISTDTSKCKTTSQERYDRVNNKSICQPNTSQFTPSSLDLGANLPHSPPGDTDIKQ